MNESVTIILPLPAGRRWPTLTIDKEHSRVVLTIMRSE
jgi:hypothetical protein